MRHLILFGLWLSVGAGDGFADPFSHGDLDSVVRTYVDDDGLANYPRLKKERGTLDAYVDSVALYSPRSHPQRFESRNHELAYWINVYNAFVLRGVIDAYPVASVKDIMLFNGFFSRLKFVAGGEKLTLNQIENEIIRPTFKDPRIHFVLNCGAASCPKLENRSFEGAQLDARLEAALTRFATDPQHVSLGEDNSLRLSKILDWYGDDFANWFPATRKSEVGEVSLTAYLLPYLPSPIAQVVKERDGIPLTFFDYDWRLNSSVALPK